MFIVITQHHNNKLSWILEYSIILPCPEILEILDVQVLVQVHSKILLYFRRDVVSCIVESTVHCK